MIMPSNWGGKNSALQQLAAPNRSRPKTRTGQADLDSEATDDEMKYTMGIFLSRPKDEADTQIDLLTKDITLASPHVLLDKYCNARLSQSSRLPPALNLAPTAFPGGSFPQWPLKVRQCVYKHLLVNEDRKVSVSLKGFNREFYPPGHFATLSSVYDPVEGAMGACRQMRTELKILVSPSVVSFSLLL